MITSHDYQIPKANTHTHTHTPKHLCTRKHVYTLFAFVHLCIYVSVHVCILYTCVYLSAKNWFLSTCTLLTCLNSSQTSPGSVAGKSDASDSRWARCRDLASPRPWRLHIPQLQEMEESPQLSSDSEEIEESFNGWMPPLGVPPVEDSSHELLRSLRGFIC